MLKRTVSALLLITAAVAAHAQVGPKAISLQGNTQYDGWKMLNSSNYSNANGQYGGGFPGSSPWANRIESDLTGSGDASFGKTAGAAYMAASGVYNGSISGDTNVKGATFTVEDATPVANLKTVVFQLEAAASFGNYTFFNNVLPTLSINGGAQTFAPTFNTLFASTPAGNSPLGNAATADLRAYQYDLSSVAVPITSISLSWTNVAHALDYSIRLDQSDVAYTQPVPEPTTLAALTLGAAAFLRRRKK